MYTDSGLKPTVLSRAAVGVVCKSLYMLQLIVNHFQVNSGHQKAIAFSAIAFIAITAKSLLLGR